MSAPDEVLFTVSGGVSLALSSWGSARADATPVVLLHGLSQQRAFWNPVVTRLRARPLAVLDQRGHGDSDTDPAADFSISACADDVIAALDHLGWPTAVVIGHSWGASVALRAAAAHPGRITGAGLVDGGLFSPSGLGPRDAVRAQLTPPSLGIPEDDLWAMIRAGDLGPWWRPEVREALAPTFVVGPDGLMRSRLGLERHLSVLEGMLDYEPTGDLDACQQNGTPVWAAVCEPRPAGPPPTGLALRWREAKDRALSDAAGRPTCVVHRWVGAIHDVPLQWPALVAGFVDALVEDVDGGTT